MKNLASLLIISVILLFFSCDKETFQDSMSLSDFYTYPNENRFAVYETSIEVGPRLEIHVISEGNKIFNEISNQLSKLSNPDEGYAKVFIRGKIVERLHTNFTFPLESNLKPMSINDLIITHSK